MQGPDLTRGANKAVLEYLQQVGTRGAHGFEIAEATLYSLSHTYATLEKLCRRGVVRRAPHLDSDDRLPHRGGPGRKIYIVADTLETS